MTTTSSDNGATGDGDNGGSGDWGWFAPARPSTRRQQEAADAAGPGDASAPAAPAEGARTDGARTDGGHDGAERSAERREMPSRPVSAIRPVGSGAQRARDGIAPSGSASASGSGSGPAPGSASAGTATSGQVPEQRRQRPGEPAVRPSERSELFDAFGPGASTGPRPSEPEPEHGTPDPPTGLAQPDAARAGASAPAGASSAPRSAEPALPAPPASSSSPASPALPGPEGTDAAGAAGAAGAAALTPAAAPAEPDPGGAEPSRDAMLIRRTMDAIGSDSNAVTAYFYALLFVQHPQLRDLFPASMDTQRDRLFGALLTAVRLVDDVPRLSEYLAGLGRGHRKYGTRPEHYPAVGECLLGALSQYASEVWDEETEAAWVRAYTTISQVMIDAAAEDERHAPAWWEAEIVAHERRTSDIAVVTVRPDQPYPFHAGQYTSIETPWWPRVWRHYSFASAPRSDGLLTFHVKAVPAGWVSSALVHRAQPGDVLRLGPPAGTMTVDHTRDAGLLCIGGGTGIAPVKALVEDVAQQGRPRPVEVFYGARSERDLYDLDTMLELEQRHRWLSVRPVVSIGPGPEHPQTMPGELPDAVRKHGPWSAYDGYLSGPPGLIRSGVDALLDAGVPESRIRHDALDELVAGGGRTSSFLDR